MQGGVTTRSRKSVYKLRGTSELSEVLRLRRKSRKQKSRSTSKGMSRSRTASKGVSRSRTASKGVSRSRSASKGVSRSRTASKEVSRSASQKYFMSMDRPRLSIQSSSVLPASASPARDFFGSALASPYVETERIVRPIVEVAQVAVPMQTEEVVFLQKKLQECQIELAKAKAALDETGEVNATICLATAREPKHVACDNFLQQLSDDEFAAWLAQIKDPQVREILFLARRQRQTRQQIRNERGNFIQQIQPSIYESNKIRKQKGLEPLPTDFPTYFAQRDLQAQTFSTMQSAAPLKRTGKAPADFVRTSPKKKSPSVEKPVTREVPKVGRLAPMAAFNPFAKAQVFSLQDPDALRSFIVSQRQAIKMGRLTVDQAVQNFQTKIPPSERAGVPSKRITQLENYIRNYTQDLPDDL